MAYESTSNTSSRSHAYVNYVVLLYPWAEMKQRIYTADTAWDKVYVCFWEPLRTPLDESGWACWHGPKIDAAEHRVSVCGHSLSIVQLADGTLQFKGGVHDHQGVGKVRAAITPVGRRGAGIALLAINLVELSSALQIVL